MFWYRLFDSHLKTISYEKMANNLMIFNSSTAVAFSLNIIKCPFFFFSESSDPFHVEDPFKTDPFHYKTVSFADPFPADPFEVRNTASFTWRRDFKLELTE